MLRLGVGGGLCQFATTLFNAAFFAGLPIVERHPHDFFIDHYPIGRDAQVAYGSQDLKFRNDTGHALLLRCWAGGGQVTVVLVGTHRAHGHLHHEPVLRPQAVGHVAQPPAGHHRRHTSRAASSSTSRASTDAPSRSCARSSRAAGCCSRDTFVSTYAPKDWIKRIGTKG